MTLTHLVLPPKSFVCCPNILPLEGNCSPRFLLDLCACGSGFFSLLVRITFLLFQRTSFFFCFDNAKVSILFELSKNFPLKIVNRLQNFHYLHCHHYSQYTIPMCRGCQISLQDSCLSFLTLDIRSYFSNCRSH